MRRRHPIWPLTLNVSELAAACGVSRRVIYDAHRAGQLTIFQHGTARRILTEDATRWIRRYWQKT